MSAVSGQLREASKLLARRDAKGVEGLCRTLLENDPKNADAWMLIARAQQQRADFPAMRDSAAAALALDPGAWAAKLLDAEAAIYVGDVAGARAILAGIETGLGDDPAAWDRLAALHTQLGQHDDCYRCALRLAKLAPLNGKFTLSSAAIALGKLDEAEALLDGIIAEAPHEGDAHYNRSTLKRQREGANHIAEMEAQLAATPSGSPAEIPLCYALAKEQEDIGASEQSFVHLKRGADARKRRLNYSVHNDAAMMGAISAGFDAEWISSRLGHSEKGPVFVVGLPRTGTTLVDRIISAHSQAASVDEANDFTFALMCAAGPNDAGGSLVERARKADMEAVGAQYCGALKGYGRSEPFLVNKTPANYLYLGIIAAALPNAKIIHLTRDPMDACYAIYKTLFRMAYPFSYDLGDLAAYHRAYSELMEHWRTALPKGRMIDVAYEDIVADQEAETRRIIDFLGLEMEQACLDFHLNPSPIATASAAQVRQPIHGRSIGKWRDYADQLKPLADALGEKS